MANQRGAQTAGATSVDQNALRFNQTMIVSLVVLAFVLGTGNGGEWIVLAVSVSMAIGAVLPGKSPLQVLYRRVALPLGILKPQPEVDRLNPHRFAQGMGAVCLIVAGALLSAGFSLIGWTVAWLVVSLALVNLVFGFCAGCFIFLQMERHHLWEAVSR